jgi:hypothetical protein
MNERIEQCLYLSGLTAQGCWDELDDYAKQGIYKFAELIVRECMKCSTWVGTVNKNPIEPINTAHAINKRIKKHFGVEE